MRGWRERARVKGAREGSEYDKEKKREKEIAGGRNGRDRVRCKGRGKERASGQGMLVGSLMRLAMHAPYGSDQISDRLPSSSSIFPPLCPPLLCVTERQSGPRLDLPVCP